MKFIKRKKTIKVRNLIYHITEWFDKHNRLVDRTIDEIKPQIDPVFARNNTASNRAVRDFLKG